MPLDWQTIRLQNHGTSVALPIGMFSPEPKMSASGNAVFHKAPDGTDVNLWRENKTKGLTVESVLKQAGSHIEMKTSSEIAGDTVHAEGLDGEVFVHRHIKIGKSGQLHGVEVRYPFALRNTLETVAREICSSLSGE